MNNNCVTVWKRIGGTCYVVNGKYYGIFKPKNRSLIQTANWEGLSLYFNQKIPKQIIVVDRDYSSVYGKHFTIENNTTDNKEFVAYKDEFELLLFPSKELKGKDITPDTDILSIDIKEGYIYSNRTITR